MAGKVVVSTLNNDTGVLATQNGMTGIPKAWVRYSAGAQVVLGSFNVSSVTYNSVGNYTVNLSTAIGNGDYGVVTDGGIDSNGEAMTNNASIASGSFGIICRGSVNTGSRYNSGTISAIAVA